MTLEKDLYSFSNSALETNVEELQAW